MLHVQRQQEILDRLRARKSVTVRALSEELYVSEATVRRDLTELAARGFLHRSHGGAILVEDDGGEISRFLRGEQNPEGKRRMAELTLPYLTEGNSFFLDWSSSVRALAGVWEPSHRTVITPGLETALLFSRMRDVQVILPGGNVRYLSGAAGGALALRMLDDMRADVLVCSCGGLDLQGNISEGNADTAEMKGRMVRHSKRHILLADATKLGVFRAFRFATLADIDVLVSDCPPGAELRRLCEAAGTRLVAPEK